MTAAAEAQTEEHSAEGPSGVQEDDLLLEHQLCFALTVAARSVVGAY